MGFCEFDGAAIEDVDGLPLFAAEVIAAAVHPHDLAATGYAEAGCGAFVRFELWHAGLLLVGVFVVVFVGEVVADYGGSGGGFCDFFVFLVGLGRGSGARRSGGGFGEGGEFPFVGREDGGHVAAFEGGLFFDGGDVFEGLDHPVDEGFADLRVGDFAPAEHDRDFDLVALFEKLGGCPRFEVDIVVVDFRLHADFAKLDVDLVFAGLALFLRLFVFEPAEVHEPRDGWVGLGGDFDEVDVALAGHGEGLGRFDDADLAALFVDQADFRNADAFVDPGLRRCRPWWYLRSSPQTAPRESFEQVLMLARVACSVYPVRVLGPRIGRG